MTTIRGYLLIVCLFSLQLGCLSQTSNDIARRAAMRQSVKSIFWSGGQDIWYLGGGNSYRLGNYAAGGELKAYASYYGIPIFSGYAYYDYIFTGSDQNLPNHCVGAGVSFLMLALDVNYFWGNDASHFRLMPKIGLDLGNASLYYGYGINLNREKFSPRLGHHINLKYFFYLQPFKKAKNQYPKIKQNQY